MVRQLRYISAWASRHTLTARVIIIIGSVLLAFLCISIGIFAADDFGFRGLPWQIAGVSIGVVAWLTYPRRNRKTTYSRRKLSDASLLLSGMILFFSHGLTISYDTPAARAVPVVQHIDKKTARKTIRSVWKSLTKAERKALRRTIRNELRAQRQNGNGSGIGLIILTIAGAVVLWLLLVALSCSIACAGSETLAWLVFIGGTAGIVLLVIAAIRGIKKRGDRIRA